MEPQYRNLHCIQQQFHPHRHTPWWSWQRYPTSQSGSRWRGQPLASKPAAAYQQWGLQLKHTGKVYYHHPYAVRYPGVNSLQHNPKIFNLEVNPPPRKAWCMRLNPNFACLSGFIIKLTNQLNILHYSYVGDARHRKHTNAHSPALNILWFSDLLYSLPHPVM